MRLSTPSRLILLAALFVVPVVAGSVAAALIIDPRPLGDGKVVYGTPNKGYVMRCGPGAGGGGPGGGAQADGPWIANGMFDPNKKLTVQGEVHWTSRFKVKVAGARLAISSNDLPRHATGTFPISPSDPAYQYDRNPNRIQEQSLGFSLPTKPRIATRPSCLSPGPIGVMLTGVELFDALDAESRDAVAHEVQDSCGGHPERTGAYHYHNLTPCLASGKPGAHSLLVGYALDGFPLYGPLGVGGVELRTANLDVCHGHAHAITLRGKKLKLYHYHATEDYPYTLGCYRGTPVRT